MNCPACRREENDRIEEIPVETIWRSYEKELGLRLPKELQKRHTVSEFITLFECRYCHVQYFYPVVPGDSEFYQALSEAPGGQYEKERWEFGLVANELSAGKHVLDLGAGPGWFLEMARARGCKVSAVDHNPVAAASLEGKSIDTYESIASYQAEDRGDPLDVVCAFHLTEHVADVGGLFREVRALLMPGGSFYVSVPNKARANRVSLEPLDVPPHHLTRWSADALRLQAQIHDFDLDYIKFEPPEAGGVRLGIRKRAHTSLRRVLPDTAAWLGARMLGRLMSSDAIVSFVRSSDRFERMRLCGHSMLARYRRTHTTDRKA